MFDMRLNQPEFLDASDCDPQLASRSYGFMRLVNRFAGGTRAITDFLAKELAQNDSTRCVRILDVGCGACDIPLSVAKWARRKNVNLAFTCIDTNETALRAADRQIEASGIDSVEAKHADILHFEPDRQYDYAIGSMFFHHFEDERIPELIKRMRSYVRTAVVINDLRRNVLSYAGCGLALLLSSSDLKHDALLSIRKGFRREELARLLGGIEDAEASVTVRSISRLVAVIRFRTGGYA